MTETKAIKCNHLVYSDEGICVNSFVKVIMEKNQRTIYSLCAKCYKEKFGDSQ